MQTNRMNFPSRQYFWCISRVRWFNSKLYRDILFMAKRWPYRLAIARLIVRTYVHALIVRVTKPRGWEWPVNVPSVTSSLRLHTQTEELGPDTLRCIFDRGEREGGGGFFAPWERVIVVSSRLLSSKHIGTIDNIARNSTGLRVGKNE